MPFFVTKMWQHLAIIQEMRNQNANTGLLSLQIYRNNLAENDKNNIIRYTNKGWTQHMHNKDNDID